MIKKFFFICLSFALSICFSACNESECNHKFVPSEKGDTMICALCTETKKADDTHTHAFSEATCESPASCACGETLEKAKGHFFSAPTCTAPSTCSVCGKTEGAPLGHKLSATSCTAAAVCTICGQTQGEALGHDFSEATCKEKATCSRCGESKGEKADHSYSGNVCKYCGEEKEDTSSYITVALTQGTPIYKGPGTGYDLAEYLSSGGKFTIVEERKDSHGNRWGKLKSGKGWVILSDTESTSPSGATVMASKISLSQVKSNHKFYSVNNTEYSTVICMRIDKTVKNVQFSSALGYGEETIQHFTLSSLSANVPLSVQIELHDFTEMYLSFDEGGTRRYFNIYISGRDGSCVVNEVRG